MPLSPPEPSCDQGRRTSTLAGLGGVSRSQGGGRVVGTVQWHPARAWGTFLLPRPHHLPCQHLQVAQLTWPLQPRRAPHCEAVGTNASPQPPLGRICLQPRMTRRPCLPQQPGLIIQAVLGCRHQIGGFMKGFLALGSSMGLIASSFPLFTSQVVS